jgi:hypothetical protein
MLQGEIYLYLLPNIILPSTFGFSVGLLHLFIPKFCTHLCVLPHVLHVRFTSFSMILVVLIMFGEYTKLWSFLIRGFSPASCLQSLSLVRICYHFQPIITHSLCSFLRDHHAFTPVQNNKQRQGSLCVNLFIFRQQMAIQKFWTVWQQTFSKYNLPLIVCRSNSSL